MRKSLRILSVFLCIAMLLALLPAMALSTSATATDLLYGKGSFDDLTVALPLDTEPHANNATDGDGSDSDNKNAVSDYTDEEVFSITEDGYTGKGLLIEPSGGGNVLEFQTMTNLDPSKTYTISLKFKQNDTHVLWNYYGSTSSTRFANVYITGTDGTPNTQYTTELGDGWYQYTFTYVGGVDTFDMLDMQLSVYYASKRNTITAGAEQGSYADGVGYMIIDDLTVTEHTHNDTDKDGYCNDTIMDYAQGCGGTAATLNMAVVAPYTKCLRTCQTAPAADDASDDVLGGAGYFDGGITAGVSTSFTYDETMNASTDGTGSAKIASASSANSARITLETGAVYTIKIKVYANVVALKSLVWNVYQYESDKSSTVDATTGYRLANLYTSPTTAKTWQEFEFPFIVNYPSVVIGLRNASSDAMWVDEMTIVKHTVHTVADLSGTCSFKYWGTAGATNTASLDKEINTVSANGSTCGAAIESDDILYGFGSFGSAVAFVGSAHTYTDALSATKDGTGAILTSTDFSQGTSVKVKKDTIYTLTVKAYASADASKLIWNLYSFNASSQVGRIANIYTTVTTANTWQTFTIQFKTNDEYIRIGLKNDSAATVYVDDMTICAHGEHDDGTTVDGLCEYMYWNFYTATGTINNVATESKNVATVSGIACGADMTRFSGATATLEDVIKLNLHVVTSRDDLYVKLDESEFARNKVQTEFDKVLVENGSATVLLPAKNMTDVITATLVDADGNELDTIKTSLREYAMAIITGASEENAGDKYYESYVKAAPVAKAMLNYGAAAQTNFSYNTSDLANKWLSAADQTISLDNVQGVAAEGVKSYEITGFATQSSVLTASSDVETDMGNGYSIAYKGTDATTKGQAAYLTTSGLVDGNTYRLSFWIKVTDANSDSTVNANVAVRTTLSDVWIYAYSSNITCNDWSYYSMDVPYSSIASSWEGRLCFIVTIGTNDLIEIAGVSVTDVDSTELMKNGSFANLSDGTVSNSNGWTVNASGTATFGYDATVDANVMTTTGTGSNVSATSWLYGYWNSAVESGKVYEINYKLKVVDSTGAALVGASDSGIYAGSRIRGSVDDYNHDDVVVLVSTYGTPDTNGWQDVKVIYTASKDNDAPIFAVALRGTYTYSFADFSIKEVVTPINTYLPTYSDTKVSTFAGYTLVMQDTTSVRLYFTEDPGTVTIGSQSYTAELGKNNLYYVTALANCAADELSAATEVTVTVGDTTMTISNMSVLAPAALAAKNTSTDAAKVNLKNTCIALILYAEAVNAYVG